MKILRFAAGVFAGVLFVAAIWLGWHERTKHVVTILPHYIFAHDFDTGTLEVQGTWTLEGETLAWPTQTTTIRCSKAAGTCIEASAVLPDIRQLFPVKINLYSVRRWDNDIIIFEGSSAACVSESYQVNVGAQLVTGLSAKRADLPDSQCSQTSAEPKKMRMIDGYEASWARRREQDLF